MSVRRSVSALLASVCLFSVAAAGASFAQDAVADAVVVDQPAVNAPNDAVDVAVEPVVNEAAAEDAAALQAAAPPIVTMPIVTMAVPTPNEPTGYEIYDDEELQLEAANMEIAQTFASNRINYLIQTCGLACRDLIEAAISRRDLYKDKLDHVNEEIRRRSVVVEPEPEPTPAAAPAVRREVTADATPPSDFCAALTAKGDYSDCGWSFRQSLKD